MILSSARINKVICHDPVYIMTKPVVSHPCGRQSWSLFPMMTLAIPDHRHIHWSWTTQSGSSSCGALWHHQRSPPSRAGGCHLGIDSVNYSCTWMVARRCHHCGRSQPCGWSQVCWGHSPVCGGYLHGEVTCRNLTGWLKSVRDALHLQHKGRKVSINAHTEQKWTCLIKWQGEDHWSTHTVYAFVIPNSLSVGFEYTYRSAYYWNIPYKMVGSVYPPPLSSSYNQGSSGG